MLVCHTSFTATSTANDGKCRVPSAIANSINYVAKLGWILINKNLISQAHLNTALNAQPLCCKKVGELLIEQHLISEEQLQQALKEQYWRRNGYWVI